MLEHGWHRMGADEMSSDILHPNRANISKDELRGKLAELYKASKDQVNVFGLQTQFGGGKTTGFALVYDSPEALKKFEPHYRLVRVGFASKIEKPSRQQRMSNTIFHVGLVHEDQGTDDEYRQATQEPTKDPPRYGKGQGRVQEEGQIDDSWCGVRGRRRLVLAGFCDGHCLYALNPIYLMHGCTKDGPFRIVVYQWNLTASNNGSGVCC
jgi:ribosomal protein S24E